MKKTILFIGLVVMNLFATGPAFADAEISLPSSPTNVLQLRIDNNTDVTAFNATVTGAGLQEAVYIGSDDKLVAFNPENGKFILYGLNADVLSNGPAIEFTFDVSAGQHVITLSDIVATNAQALAVSVTALSDGVIDIRFDIAEIHKTADVIIGLSVDVVVDVNQDGAITIHDVQVKANNIQ